MQASFFLNFFFTLIYFVCIVRACVCVSRVCPHVVLHVWMREDGVWLPLFSFCHVGSRDQNQVPMLSAWAFPAGPSPQPRAPFWNPGTSREGEVRSGGKPDPGFAQERSFCTASQQHCRLLQPWGCRPRAKAAGSPADSSVWS